VASTSRDSAESRPLFMVEGVSTVHPETGWRHDLRDDRLLEVRTLRATLRHVRRLGPPALSLLDLSLLGLAALFGGLSKTALPGAATVAVAVFAAILPAKQSTGALLVLLILGDLFAVRFYHAHAD